MLTCYTFLLVSPNKDTDFIGYVKRAYELLKIVPYKLRRHRRFLCISFLILYHKIATFGAPKEKVL